MFNYPVLLFPLSLFVLWLSALVGILLRSRRPLIGEEREDFGFVQAAALTLLGLIIGFSFSMAIGRYDQRRNYEEAEANAIGTEYVRAGLLPASDAARVRAQLAKYLDLRVSFYRTRNQPELQQINADTGQLQTEMWTAVQSPALAQPTPVMALAVAGMNDVLNSQGYTQAAWWNRIPNRSMGSNDHDCYLLQFAGRIWCARRSHKKRGAPDSAIVRIHCISSHRRHRCPAWGANSRASAKSAQPFPIIAETVGSVRFASLEAYIICGSRNPLNLPGPSEPSI